LNEKNVERQVITEEIVKQFEEQIKEDDKIIIGICPEERGEEFWEEGVVGLVAGKITEKYYKPTLVITRCESGLKGSGRSIEELNIIKTIEECGEFLSKFGGHPAACGFSLDSANFDNFADKIREVASKKLAGADLRPKLKIEAELGLEEISEALIGDIEKFGPFGQGNDRPKFISRNVMVMDKMNMGVLGQHIKLRLKNDRSGIINAIGFGQSQHWNDLAIGDRIDIVYNLDLNEFNGRREAQMRIVDIMKCKI
ncbi:MAG: DHHA1 domain-containing protein, partial [Patescibacteria group bacterium]